MDKDAKIYVAGHRGMVGSAITRRLKEDGYTNLVTRTSDELDLTDQHQTREFFQTEQPDYVFLAAAKVGGIIANRDHPAEFIYDNLAIQTHAIHEAYQAGVTKLCFLGSSCIYPKHAPQPMTEEHLLTGELEQTNQWYAIAKIAGIKQCQAYRRQYGFNAICLQPTNLYGPNDNYHPEHSHVMAALIRRFHEAAQAGKDTVTVWGTGEPRREFLHVDDLADAAVFLMDEYDEEEIINVGTGKDISISELAELIAEVIGFEGEIVYDTSKPDGTPRKLLDVSQLERIGWSADIGLRDGLEHAHAWFRKHHG